MCHVAGGGGAGERWGGALRAVFTDTHAPLPVDLVGLALGLRGLAGGKCWNT